VRGLKLQKNVREREINAEYKTCMVGD